MSTLMSSRSESTTMNKEQRPISFSGMNVNQVKSKLAAQLDDKETMLQKVDSSQITRNAYIKQTDVIRKEIQYLDKYGQEDELPIEVQTKLEGLANEFQYLKSSKSTLGYNSHVSYMSPLLPPPPTNSSPTMQRSKAQNGNRRNPDIEFATEIGQGLLIEVRKLQSALQEKEEMIKQLEFSKADNERNQETAQRHLKQREEVEERLKEENWNLEVANQELRTHLTAANQTVAKHSADFGRLTKQLKSQSEQIDIMKAQEEKSASVIEAMKARHEQETYQLRRHAASAQRENAASQKQVEALNTEVKIVQAKLAIKMATSTRTANDDTTQIETSVETNDDNDSENDNKDASAPTTALPGTRTQQVMETETLKQSLAHAHRIISNLRSSYHKEKLEKFELKKMLSDSQENIEQMRKEMSSWNSNNAGAGNTGSRSKSNGKKKHAVTKKKRGGVARQARGLTLNESDSDQSHKSEGEIEDDNMSEENESSPEDYEQHFTSFGNSFEGIPDFNGFSSIAMKPLSSELKAKIQVVDAGINTDPVDPVMGPCVHGLISDSFVVPIQHAPLHQETPSLISSQNGANNNSRIETVTPDLSSVSSEEYTASSTNEECIQDRITKAVLQDRKEIVERVESILSPEQIQSLIIVTSSAPIDIKSTYVNDISRAVENVASDNNLSTKMVSQKDVDQLIQIAVEKETSNMVPKVHVEKLIQEAVLVEQEKIVTMIPKVEAEKLVEEAVEKMKTEAEVMVRETRAELQAQFETTQNEFLTDMILKSEAEKLIEKTVEKMKVEAEIMVQETRAELQAQCETTQKELLADMVPKAEAEILAFEAVRLAKEKIKQEASVSRGPEEEMITKSEAEELVKLAASKEQLKVQQALEKQKAEIETATMEAHKKELDSHIEIQKAEFESIKQKSLAELELINQAALEKQKAEMEAAKLASLEKQKLEIEALKQTELEHQKLEIEKAKQVELEKQMLEIEALKQAECEQQKLEAEAVIRAELENKLADMEAAKELELQKQKEESHTVRLAELAVLKKSIESYKKECEETNQRMITMLTKDSADVLVKRAVTDALEKAEKNQASVLAGMMSKEYALLMVKDEVSKALEKERKEVSEREEREEKERLELITKAEAEALAKVAAADAIVKERQAQAARESELVTKDEVNTLTEDAVREALEKERSETAAVLARERKLLREKEERMISKEEAEQNVKEAVRLALLNKKVPEITILSNMAPAGSNDAHSLQTPIPSSSSRHSESSSTNTSPFPAIEKSVSTSRLAPPTLNVSPAPSISTPASSSSRKLRLSSSVSSFRLGRKESNIEKSQRQSTDSQTPSTFGSFRILENSKYISRLQSKSSISLKELSQKQDSVTSISTLSSEDAHSNRMHLPMSSEESFPGFSSGGTDMYVISAITQTMIGEWMSKHTRRYVGGGISENKHQRFFWVHPYTKILYWSSTRPGAEGNEAKTKSAFIESVSAVPSHDTTGASPMSLMIRTPKRDLKLTTASLERHDLWLKSLSYLLGRPDEATNQLMEEPRLTTESSATTEGHLSKNASSKSINQSQHDVSHYDSDDSDDLMNIRQCCDGKHDVATLSRGHNHHHRHS